MNELFLKVINMSISANWLVLAVLLLRLILKIAPKWITVFLWGLVAIRLICPFSFESTLSLIPRAEIISPAIMTDPSPSIHTGMSVINNIINPVINNSFAPAPGASANPLQLWIPILCTVWFIGIGILLFYTAVSYWRLKRKVDTGILYLDNIYQSENVHSPFVLGILKPKIYLPFNMSDQILEQVIAHEQAHIRRKDHWWKPLGFLLLTIHWFNPLIWLSYILLCRDIELACDEKVIKELDNERRADYTQALLVCSINHPMIAACPLAFGEVGVKERVKAVMHYKKPAFCVLVLAILACAGTALCFLTNPSISIDEKLTVFIDCQIASFNQTDYSKEHFCCLDWEVIGKETSGDLTTVYLWALYKEYSKEDELKVETASHLLTAITVKKEQENYSLVEYWIPADGSSYSDSIKEKVPIHLWGKALDSQRYIDRQSEKLEKMAKEHFEVTPSDINGSNSHKNETDLSFDEAISLTILEHNSSDKPDGLLHVESHILLANEETSGTPLFGSDDHAEKITAYLLVHKATYSIYGGTMEAVGGSYGPVAITFHISDSGEYILEEYWEPRDGSGYAKDIRDKFPGASADDALNDQAYIEDLKAETYNKALAYLNSNLDLVVRIGELIDEIQTSPSSSSIPEDYIHEHEEAYEELLSYGRYTLQYSFSQFLQGGQTGLPGHIMAAACIDISNDWGESLLIDGEMPSNGQAWFDIFQSNSKTLATQCSREDLEKFYPVSFLLLQMTDENFELKPNL